MQHVTDCHVDPVTTRVTAEERAEAEVQRLAVAGMGCPNCANRVRNALLEEPGIVDVEVDPQAGLATIWCRPGSTRTRDLLEAVDRSGRGTLHRYLAVPVSPDE